MSLELINTLGTLTTVVIVAATAIAALVQLRHLRSANQINAMLSIGDQLDRRAFREALYLVARRLESAFQDPAFRNHVAAIARGLAPPEVSEDHLELRHAAQLVGNTYEERGIIRAWDGLQNFTAFFRNAAGADHLWENFELLTVTAQDWRKQYPSGIYPRGVRRLAMHNPWPVPPMPATG